MNSPSRPLIPPHGGYRKLKSFQIAQLTYDLTVSFVEHYIPRGSRTCDQMVQAARSGVQNIAEGSMAGGTSRKTELKLTNVARASLEELRLDYEDFLRQRGYQQWPFDDPRWRRFTAARCGSLNEVRDWINAEHFSGRLPAPVPEIAANAALILIRVSCSLLDRQLSRLAADFEREGGFTERLYRVRSEARVKKPQ
jgi:four helix bundle suffix protein